MFIDYGMFMANLMTAARARGLDTCPQAAFADYHKTIRETLGIPLTTSWSSAAWRLLRRPRRTGKPAADRTRTCGWFADFAALSAL